jgi:hypothetical protein
MTGRKETAKETASPPPARPARRAPSPRCRARSR